MQRNVSSFLDQRRAHEVPVAEDRCRAESGLWKLQHDANLGEKVIALAAQDTLLFDGHAVHD